jgi:hypothetical protein
MKINLIKKLNFIKLSLMISQKTLLNYERELFLIRFYTLVVVKVGKD